MFVFTRHRYWVPALLQCVVWQEFKIREEGVGQKGEQDLSDALRWEGLGVGHLERECFEPGIAM